MKRKRGDGQAPSPARIMALATAFWQAEALLTANRLGVFTALADGRQQLTALCRQLGIAARPGRLFLNALVAMDLLELDAGGYASAAEARLFLTPGRPGYLGNALRYSDNVYPAWGRLEEALREDRPVLAAASYTGDDPGLTRDFVRAMHERALGEGRVLTELVDLAGHRRMLDVGGGPGTYSALFAARYPGLDAVLLDLPGVVTHAREIVAEMGVGERIEMRAGDYHTAPFPGGCDVVLLSGVLHRESGAECRALLQKAAACLEPGGLVVVSDVFTDGGGTSPEFAALFGLNMLLTAPSGGVHADADLADWMAAAGLACDAPVAFPPPLPHRVLIGRKTG